MGVSNYLQQLLQRLLKDQSLCLERWRELAQVVTGPRWVGWLDLEPQAEVAGMLLKYSVVLQKMRLEQLESPTWSLAW